MLNCQVALTNYGSIRGYTTQSKSGKVIEIFKGVPFAKPPIGKLRYAKPQPADRWEGVLDGTKYRYGCLSNSSQTTSPQTYIDEDCLYLNIFTSKRCRENPNCPVLYYIHGGAFLYDSAIMFPDEHMIERYAAKDTVMVIAAFRLATWGLFASQFEEVTPHNLGVYEVVLGLEFLQTEVRSFGGDPRKVTSLGHSMGADLSIAIAFSDELNRGNRILAQAMAMSPSMDYHNLDMMHWTSFEFARRAGCTPPGAQSFESAEATQKIVDCLRTKTWQELLLIQRGMDDDGMMKLNGFPRTSPIVSSGSLYELLLNSPRVPLLLGSTRQEFDPQDPPEPYHTYGDMLQTNNSYEVGIKFWHDRIHGYLASNHSYESQCIYTSTFNYGQVQAKKGAPVYLYRYDMRKWSHHTSDLCYVMGVHCRKFTRDEQIIDGFYSELFVNFTHQVPPTKSWAPLDPERKNFFRVLVIEKEDKWPHMENGYEEEVVDYWVHKMTEFDQTVTRLKTKLVHEFLEQKTDE
ncbi:unnamed protein product, partial [Mesorhabditis spiculigera]